MTAALDARYVITPPPAWIPPMEVRLRIEPPPCSAMYRAASRVPAITARTLTRITASKSARSSSKNRRCIRPETPALLTMTSRPPKVSTAVDTSRPTCSMSPTSVNRKLVSSPSSSARTLPRSSSMSPIITWAPSAANRRTSPSPSPAAPPVTTTTFPASSFITPLSGIPAIPRSARRAVQSVDSAPRRRSPHCGHQLSGRRSRRPTRTAAACHDPPR